MKVLRVLGFVVSLLFGLALIVWTLVMNLVGVIVSAVTQGY